MRSPSSQYTTRTATCFVCSTTLSPARWRQYLDGDQIRIPRVVITFFFFSHPFPRRYRQNCHPCVMSIFPIYQLFVPHFAMAVLCVYRINKQRGTSFEFSTILSTVDLSKHLIMVESFENLYSSSICDLQCLLFLFRQSSMVEPV